MFEVKPGKDIPNKATSARRGPKCTYPFNKMKVGDAFLCPPDSIATIESRSGQPRVAAAAYSYGKAHGMKFQCLKQAGGSIRVERIA